MIPDVTREIGGEIYTLRFSARTTIAIEQEFGCKFSELEKITGKVPDLRTTAKLVKLCIRKDGQMLTEEEFDHVLDHVSLNGLAGLLTDAMDAATVKKTKSSGN